MPGAGMNCLNTIQPIFGADFHRTIPPTTVPSPFAPHFVVWGVGWSQKMEFPGAFTNSKAASPDSKAPHPVSLCCGYAIGRGHDAGPHPGHIWPNILLPLILLGSGSKSEFGSGTVRHRGGNMAIAVGNVFNLNLNCQDFPVPPLPTGLVMTMLSTVKAGFTLGDFLGGMFSMNLDMILTWISGHSCVYITSRIRGIIGALSSIFHGGAFVTAFGRGFGRNISQSYARNLVSRIAPRELASAFRTAAQTPFDRELLCAFPKLMGPIGSVVSIFGVGSPVGYSHSISLFGQMSPEGQPNLGDLADRIPRSLLGEPPNDSPTPPSGGSTPSSTVTPPSGTGQ